MKANHALSAGAIRPETIRYAYFIKLGRGGKWEVGCLDQGLARIGWSTIPLQDVVAGDWKKIKRQIRREQANQGAATRDSNALHDIVTSTEEDVWITFHAACLWWCRLSSGPVEEDETSKFRRTTADGWRDHDVRGNKLLAAGISGHLSKIQRFSGTACKVNQIHRLQRLLNAEVSPAYRAVSEARAMLITHVEPSLVELHWKDFETLVDLLFRNAGWRRLSVLGETMKYADLELEEPINRERYQVQIKSAADARDFAEYRDQFSGQGFRKLFFVVHSPSRNLIQERSTDTVELVLPARLAEMVVDAGLVSWVLSKIR
jgi:hypothetical protein